MKKILLICCIFIVTCIHIDSQNVIKEPEKLKVGFLGLNSPDNYYGIQQYHDTLSIDLINGEKIEIVYRWFDLFRENEDRFERYFWQPFESNFKILQEKLKEVPLDNALKYFVQLKTTRNLERELFGTSTVFGHQNYASFRDSLTADLNKDNKKAYKDSVSKRLQKYFRTLYRVESTLKVSEREVRNAQREYKLEDDKLVGRAQWQHILEVANKFWKVRFYVNDLNDLQAINDIDLREFIRGQKDHYIKRRYYLSYTNLKYKLVDDEIVQIPGWGDRVEKREKHIALKVYPTLGTSLLKSTWSADMGAVFGMVFNEQRSGALRIALRYQLKALGEEELNGTSIRYNGFVDGMFDFNLAKSYQREQWLGAGVGYLVHQEGRVYGDNTARIFLKYRSSQRWGVQPEFNYSFSDNNGFVGLGFFFSL
ncbi:MAG: hypothetical protein N4A71_00705 [Carboxylicivirga sp.]|jgi:hypothetical protein|nr:hypothetical protein [Carboxylicivirga sp.]